MNFVNYFRHVAVARGWALQVFVLELRVVVDRLCPYPHGEHEHVSGDYLVSGICVLGPHSRGRHSLGIREPAHA